MPLYRGWTYWLAGGVAHSRFARSIWTAINQKLGLIEQSAFHFFGLGLVLVLSVAVLVIVIDLSIIRCARLGDTIEFHRHPSQHREHVDEAPRVIATPRMT